VLRYGVMRELTLGLEVVLPDGRIWDGLRALRKDNSGYDLRDLFIGSEGTLGVVTAAVLRLFPQPRARATAFVALPGLEAALKLLQIVRGACADRVAAFEFLTRETMALILRHTPGLRAPFADIPAASVLVELSEDAVLAADLAQAKAFWRLRESVSEALVREGKAAKHDVSTPVAAMARFVAAADAAVARVAPGARPIVFGHLGDGNLHYNVLAPPGGEEAFAAQAAALTRAVHEETLRGSISAEHGVGQLRVAEMALCKSPLDLDLMRAIKQAFDPLGVMNPGKLLP
jgi:FAD/FMN-containing dehydrogenase